MRELDGKMNKKYPDGFTRENIKYAETDNDKVVLMLAHAYSCAFNFLVPMAFGAHVYFLGKAPSPKILLKAFEEVKPHLIITVSLLRLFPYICQDAAVYI